MTTTRDNPSGTIQIERSYTAPIETIWEFWTTAQGIEKWWSPDGFRVDVQTLELKPGGSLVYTMTATGPEQIEFMRQAGMPLVTESRKTFTEVKQPSRLAYQSLADFIPGVAPYDFLTVVDMEPSGDQVRVRMTVEKMHDDVWTERLVMGRQNELENLAKVIERRR